MDILSRFCSVQQYSNACSATSFTRFASDFNICRIFGSTCMFLLVAALTKWNFKITWLFFEASGIYKRVCLVKTVGKEQVMATYRRQGSRKHNLT